MKHRAFAPMLGAVAALFIAAGMAPQAMAADPSGIWAKDDGSAKMEVRKCGRGICSKIVWLREPMDSRGKPLHDARNQDPSMRGRPIMGLPLFSNMAPTAENQWVGNVYNPEEGRIYSDVKVTLVSSQQMVLKGCKAWLLCGEKVWIRSKLAPVPAEPAEPIEAKAPAEPEDGAPRPDKDTQGTVVEASREPEADARSEPGAKRGSVSAKPALDTDAVTARSAKGKTLDASPEQTLIGPGVVATTADQEPLPLSADNVSSMMAMTKPAPVKTAEPKENKAAAENTVEEQDTPRAARPYRARPRVQTSAQATRELEPSPSIAAKPKPRPRTVVREPEEPLPWLQRP